MNEISSQQTSLSKKYIVMVMVMVTVMYLTGSIFYLRNTSSVLYHLQILTDNVVFTNISAVRVHMCQGIRVQIGENPMYLYATNAQDEPSLKIPKILHFVWI